MLSLCSSVALLVITLNIALQVWNVMRELIIQVGSGHVTAGFVTVLGLFKAAVLPGASRK